MLVPKEQLERREHKAFRVLLVRRDHKETLERKVLWVLRGQLVRRVRKVHKAMLVLKEIPVLKALRARKVLRVLRAQLAL
jgi:hypothetical protein